MAAKKAGLGRGLGALIEEVPAETSDNAAERQGVARIPVDRVDNNPWQPRRHFAPEALEDLVHSIRTRGVLQPLLVRRMDDGYQLIAGERRLTAAREAGLEEVPAVVMELDDREALEVALVENLQREDLNLIEEAEGYQALCEEFNMTQEQVAERVGKARASVTNALRLLKLPGDVRELISQKQLSAGHAKVLLGLEIPEEQGRWAQRVVREDMSVRELEKQMTRAHRPRRRKRTSQSDLPEEHMRYLIDQLHQHLGTSVRIAPCRTLANGKKTKGCIEIDFYSGDELDRILQMLGFTDSV